MVSSMEIKNKLEAKKRGYKNLICPSCDISYQVNLEDKSHFCQECGNKLLYESEIIIKSKEERKKELQELIEETKSHFNESKDKYKIEARLADKVYKAYITDGLSRLEKINGRFLASQTMKLDTIIQQNGKIIELLQKIVEK